MVATISDKLSKEIADQSLQIQRISQRLIWGLRGFVDRLHRNACNIPFTDTLCVHVRKCVHVYMCKRVCVCRSIALQCVQHPLHR